MPDLDDLRMVRAIGHAGSLAGAARLMDVTPPALTVRLRKLEESLGVRLAVRTARGIAFTDEGRRLLDESAELLERFDALRERVAGESQALDGHLRVVAPFGFGRRHVARIVRELHQQHPQLGMALTLSDNPLREAAAHDVVVHIGTVKDSSWVGHLLAPNDRLLCASPGVARRLGSTLTHPAQLERHACLCLKENDDGLVRWRFLSAPAADGTPRKSATVRVDGALTTNDGETMTQWALSGLGIMARSEWEVGPLIAAGRLVRLLPQWQMEPAPVMALVPSRKGLPARQRVFIEAAKAGLQPVPWRTPRQRG
ncbi:LysR family transcriptional regulator [Acidovorax sp. GBBC 3334]|uniref:LysR family transcriptional regulator n=1 Tax=Acidovorax sp. GBBC 3334 TaxID=2940496 RepID=UPI00230217CF|nr:LysR family transcriptional regulator [Acidovorax sp. GBBC 3334]MDA8454972.1 LysR family transcriptional regulator [Acidovorax sp. GBBC 3334]